MDNNAIHELEPFWGNWYIDSFIGEGSFGKVYKIYREEFEDKHYAALKIISIPRNASELKQIYFEGMNDESASKYFSGIVEDIYNEIVLMTKLKGKTNIVSYEDHNIIKRKQGVGYDILIRMELLTSLNDYVIKNQLTNALVIRMGIDICNALTLCEKRNIIHRDIKPDNIFLSNDGDFKLGDFGIAKQLDEAFMGLSIKGSYEYMAPEVYNGKNYDHRVDIYSLGLLLYTFLNKRKPPFVPSDRSVATHGERQEALRKRFTGEKLIPPVDATEKLSEIVLKACAYNPLDRYDTAMEFKTALEGLTKEEIGFTGSESSNQSKLDIVVNSKEMKKDTRSNKTNIELINTIDDKTGFNENKAKVLQTTSNEFHNNETKSISNSLNEQEGYHKKSVEEREFISTDYNNLQSNIGVSDNLYIEDDSLDKTVLIKRDPIIDVTQDNLDRTVFIQNDYNRITEADDFDKTVLIPKENLNNTNRIPTIDDKKDKSSLTIESKNGNKISDNNIDSNIDNNINNKSDIRSKIDKSTKVSNLLESNKRSKTLLKILVPILSVVVIAIGVLSFLVIRNQENNKKTNPVVAITPSPNGTSTPLASSMPSNTAEPSESLNPGESTTPQVSPSPIADSNLQSNTTESVKDFVLDYSDKKLKDISKIKDIQKVTDLTLDNNQIANIEELSKSIYLTSLSIANNKLVDINPLFSLTRLNYLWLSDNDIVDIGSLRGLYNLQLIYLDGNNIKDIQSLEGLTNLTDLYLNNNKLSDISALKNLTNLKALSLANNNIKDLSPLYGLKKLKTIDISGNKISKSEYKKLKENLPKDCLIVK